MFHTNYDTASDKFQNYYKDISLRMKNKELDLLIVVNMFLTGFDATTLNTLWVDKNLKMHGLIQAFSRTNRILNSIKTFGNIVCFRNLQKRVDAAISLFGDKNAGGIVLMKSFKDYYYGYESVDGKQMPGYVDMIEELKLQSLCNFVMIFLNRMIRIYRKFLKVVKDIHLIFLLHKIPQYHIKLIIFQYKSLSTFSIRCIMRLGFLQKIMKLSQKLELIMVFDIFGSSWDSFPVCFQIFTFCIRICLYSNMLYKVSRLAQKILRYQSS